MNLCYLIASQIYQYRARHASEQRLARQNDDSEYWKWQFQSSRDYFAKFFDLEGRLNEVEVIDIGCGLGGRTCYLAKQGVRRIVGTDTNHMEIDRACQLAEQLGDREIRQAVQFEKVSEDDMEEGSMRYDVALLIDSLEHVRDPIAMLNHAHSLLKPGGTCYFSTWGWYHHQASHVSSIVPIPFATVLFSDRQILDAVRRIVDQPYYQPTIWDSDPPSQRWQDCLSLHDRPGEHLNKFTIAKFRKSMQASKFSDWQLKVQGFSANRHPCLAAFNFLTRIPAIQELYHSAVFGKLTKEVSHHSTTSSRADSLRPVRISA